MSNPFSIFYDKTIGICSVTKGRGYSDRDVCVKDELCSLQANLQPYNSGLAERKYGLHEECQYRMFTAGNNSHVDVGNYAVIDDALYRIICVERWDFGDVAVLQKG